MIGRILVVGGVEGSTEALIPRLEEEGFEVLTAERPEEVLTAVAATRPDLVVFDVPARLLDVLEACRLLRRRPETAPLPVLILDSGSGEQDRILALEEGADEFLSRPFHTRELIARLRALLRRSSPASQPGLLRAGRLELDPGRYTASLAGRGIRLTAKEFELLRTLMESGGRVLRREQLLERVWRYGRSGEIQSRTLDVHIRRLRRKLGVESRRIVTVRGVGYRFDMLDAARLTLSDRRPRWE